MATKRKTAPTVEEKLQRSQKKLQDKGVKEHQDGMGFSKTFMWNKVEATLKNNDTALRTVFMDCVAEIYETIQEHEKANVNPEDLLSESRSKWRLLGQGATRMFLKEFLSEEEYDKLCDPPTIPADATGKKKKKGTAAQKDENDLLALSMNEDPASQCPFLHKETAAKWASEKYDYNEKPLEGKQIEYDEEGRIKFGKNLGHFGLNETELPRLEIIHNIDKDDTHIMLPADLQDAGEGTWEIDNNQSFRDATLRRGNFTKKIIDLFKAQKKKIEYVPEKREDIVLKRIPAEGQFPTGLLQADAEILAVEQQAVGAAPGGNGAPPAPLGGNGGGAR
jgi:hypothetical protein